MPQLPGLLPTPLADDPLRLAIPINLTNDIRRLSRAASRHWVSQQCTVAGFGPDIRYSSTDLQAHVQLIEAGQAVTMLPGMVGGYRPPQATWVPLVAAPQRHIFLATRQASAQHPGSPRLRLQYNSIPKTGRNAKLSGYIQELANSCVAVAQHGFGDCADSGE